VPGVGEQGERVAEERGDDFKEEEGEEQTQCDEYPPLVTGAHERGVAHR
jgi:hypothetical protein